ncbi:amidohydrolase family protein [Amaricoccus solimangrovi]|uniref:Amidohydrolase n=1 Tax=Amaricoccus solimangrovi TaxID=2589815 RepID=A0A501WVN0_9RHOB|nr:amidohydrolase family protein [Amaricoccus solimangrovi]TPE51011.1 amidohydrolase [Amaricoccus solimangrovi]
MPVIDAHCHFWRLDRGDYGWLAGTGGPLAPIRRDFAPGDYPGAARIIAVQAAPTLAETDYLLGLARAHDAILGVVGWVDLAAPGAVADLAARAGDPALLGIRPMLQDIAETDWILTAPRPDALAALADLGLAFDALVTTRHLPALARFAAENPELPLVIDHAAKPRPGDGADWEAGMRALAADPRVHCKLSGLLTELPAEALRDPAPALGSVVGRLLDWFGPERLIWGSDWPVLTLAAPYADWAALTERLLGGLTAAEREGIMGGNAARFYGVAA